MNSAQKKVVLGGALALALVALFPPWRQTYQGRLLVYNEKMGHHLLFLPPAPTGEQSWIIQAPAADCKVEIEARTLLKQCGMVAVFVVILLVFFRGWPGPGLHAVRRTVVASLLLALCLPLPPLDGPPLGVVVGMAFASPFMDSGHLGPWFVPMLAAGGLAAYSVPIFLVLGGLTWRARRRAGAVSK